MQVGVGGTDELDSLMTFDQLRSRVDLTDDADKWILRRLIAVRWRIEGGALDMRIVVRAPGSRAH